MRRRDGGRLEPSAPGAKATRLELFYDLVFVVAFFSVSTTTFTHYAPANLVSSMLVLALLWFAWTSFAALGNRFRADQGLMPLIGLATMIAIFIASIALTHAFGAEDELAGDILFTGCYLFVRLLQTAANWYLVRQDPQLRYSLWKLAVPLTLTSGFLLAGALLPPRLFEGATVLLVQLALWAVGIVVAYAADIKGPAKAITIVSATHWPNGTRRSSWSRSASRSSPSAAARA